MANDVGMTLHQHMREGNSLKPTNLCSLKNRLWLLRYVGRPTPKMIKRWTRKTATNIKTKITPQMKKGTLRVRESPQWFRHNKLNSFFFVTVQVHKSLLAATSDYFRVMFGGMMAESQQNTVDLKGVTADGLQHIIDFIYRYSLSFSSHN